MDLVHIKNRVLMGDTIAKEEAMMLFHEDLDTLCQYANEIRNYFCGNAFDLCTIVNGKSGKCSENCKFCAQSSCYATQVNEYSLLSTEHILADALYYEERGVLRYSIVTSGRNLSDQEINTLCDTYRTLRSHSSLSLCASHGLLTYEQFLQLKDAGVQRYHNNLETSRGYFKSVCTTHCYEDKIRAIKDALRAGLEVCSGGILGLGETMEDRIDMALELRELGIQSIPINVLNPIKGTPYEDKPSLDVDEVRRTVAIFRFLLPDAAIRLAGGRGLLYNAGETVFLSGANAAITGEMLTTSGIMIEKDFPMMKALGFEVRKLG